VNTDFIRLFLIALALIFISACSPSGQSTSPEDPARPQTSPAADAKADSTGLVEAVSRMAAIGRAYGASFSPDGERIAFISSGDGVPQVWVADREGKSMQQVSWFEDQVGSVAWSPAADVLAVSVAPGGGLNIQIYLLSLEGTEPQLITEGGQDNNWLTRWSDDGRFISYSSNAAGPGSMDCYLYDSEDGVSRRISSNQGIGNCVISPNNERALAWRMHSRGNTDVYLVDLVAGTEQLLTPHSGVALSGQAIFAGDDTIYLSTNVDRERTALARIEVDANGVAGPLEVIAGRDDAELASLELMSGQNTMAILWNASGRSELAFLDLGRGSLIAGPDLPAEIAGGLAASHQGDRLAMTVSGAAEPSNVWLQDPESQNFIRISSSAHEGVDLESLVRPELLGYSAHDGLALSGWLYRAPGAGAAGPVVLSFHGGPEGQERPSFRSTYQALAARGISVFAPNVRGSSGFGKTFVNLDNGALRFDGVKDIESTVRFVIEAGIADPERIGIMGGSYGGYMVMAGLTEFPELFSAGANLYGVVNFATFFANTEPWMAAISTVEYGDPVKDAELLEQLSPIHKVGLVTAPTIVLHGANDTNVPVVEAEQVVASLEERGVPVKYVLFPDEGHGWRKTGNRITSDVEIVKWFEANL